MAVIKLSESKINFVKEVCKSFGNKPGEVINVLHKVQGEFGYLPAEVQELVAKELNIPVSRVYGIVSFYSFFTMTPKGEHPISVCLGTACYVRGAEKATRFINRHIDGCLRTLRTHDDDDALFFGDVFGGKGGVEKQVGQ